MPAPAGSAIPDMPVNDTTATTLTRQPRAQVLTNGTPIPGVVSFSVSNNAYRHADTMEVTFATSAGSYDANFWGSQTGDILLDVQASLDAGNSWKSLILGASRQIHLDPIHKTITVSAATCRQVHRRQDAPDLPKSNVISRSCNSSPVSAA